MSMLRFGRPGSPVYHHQAAARPKGLKYAVENGPGIAEFVIGITDQKRIHRAGRQVWIVVVPENNLNIVLASKQRP